LANLFIEQTFVLFLIITGRTDFDIEWDIFAVILVDAEKSRRHGHFRRYKRVIEGTGLVEN
jgi:hypothetical protein